jgi:ABC-type transporter Mla subunit MlaD
MARADAVVTTAAALRSAAAELARFSKDLDRRRRDIVADMRHLNWPLDLFRRLPS